MAVLFLIILLAVPALVFAFLGGRRPDAEKYKAMCNSSRGDDLWAYREAAKSLGVTIWVGYPVPCVAGARVAASSGMVGIYILREDAGKEFDLTIEKHKKFLSLSQ